MSSGHTPAKGNPERHEGLSYTSRVSSKTAVHAKSVHREAQLANTTAGSSGRCKEASTEVGGR